MVGRTLEIRTSAILALGLHVPSYLNSQHFKFTTQEETPKQALKSHKVTPSEIRLCHPWPLDFQNKDDSQRPET